MDASGARSLMTAREGHECDGQDLSCREVAIRRLTDQHELLCREPCADRQDHVTAGLELLDERWRNVTRDGGDDYDVEGGMFRPAVVAITDAHRNVRAAKPLEPLPRLDAERL